MWSLQVHDTMTGAFKLAVNPATADWTRRLGNRGEGTHGFPLKSEQWKLDRAQNHDLFADTENTLVPVWNGTPMYAGWIDSQPVYDQQTGMLSVHTAEIRTLFKDRLLHGVNNYAAGNLAITKRSEPAAVRAILQRATQWGPAWKVPLVLPDDGPGSFTVDWRNYQGLSIEDCLQAVEKRGYEIDFYPEFAADGSLQWLVRVARRITGAAFDLPVASGRVLDLKTHRDAKQRLTGVIVFGNGTDADMLTAWAGVPNFRGPVRDAARQAKDEREVDQLQKIADAQAEDAAEPVKQWDFKVLLDGVTAVQLSPGRILNMDIREDPWEPDGMHRKRVIAVSGDLTDKLKPEVQDA